MKPIYSCISSTPFLRADVRQVNHSVNHTPEQRKVIQAVSDPRTSPSIPRPGSAATLASHHVSSDNIDHEHTLQGSAKIHHPDTKSLETRQNSRAMSGSGLLASALRQTWHFDSNLTIAQPSLRFVSRHPGRPRRRRDRGKGS